MEVTTAAVSDEIFERAAASIRNAGALIITAGAGMGVDSGLPDFRGDNGFWNAYPVYEKLGIRFEQMATPRHFAEDPSFAWGFYGHRCNLYKETVPHAGFAILQEWIRRFDLPSFVVTSNVDGHFQKAGFEEDKIVEVHGSIHHMQCQGPCKAEIWEHSEVFDLEMSTMRAQNIPGCINCSETARPNILMFNDWWFLPARSNAQQRRFEQFIASCPRPITVVEIGAGLAIPTIRWEGENLGRKHGATVIRINPREAEISQPHLSVPTGGALALSRINQLLQRVQ
jgi:NAD-dependent SIR2 family protein deacetylase